MTEQIPLLLLESIFSLRCDIISLFLPIALSTFSFPFTVNKHTNYGSPRCMGLSTDASSLPGVIFQDFDSLQGIGKRLPLFCRTISNSVELALPKAGQQPSYCTTQSERTKHKKDMSKKSCQGACEKGFLPSSGFNSPS